MNIWCISKYASLPKYGTAPRLFYLAKEFARLKNNVVLITSNSNHLANFPDTGNRYNFEKSGNVDVCWIRTKKYKKTASIGRVLSWLDFEWGLFSLERKKFAKPDVVIVSSLSLLSIVYGVYLKKRYKAFLIFEVRDIWPLTLIAEGGFSRWHPLSMFLSVVEKFGYKNSDLIVGTMPRLDLHVEKILGYSKPFYCSPLGYDKNQIVDQAVEKNNALAKYFPEGKIIIGYAGSMGVTNALEPFIQCILSFGDNSCVHFVLVGGGDLKEEYAARLSSSSNVTFVPRIKQELVPTFLDYCDILYLSTHDSQIWHFGQSMNKLVQYMLAGKPIIASYSGYESMLNEANAGKFIDANKIEPLKKALFDYISLTDEQRVEIGARGKRWIIENRSYVRLAEEYIEKIKAMMITDR